MSIPTIRAAAEYFGVPYADMFGPIRLREYTHARFASYYIMRERDCLPYPQIGRRFNKDHSTVIHGHRRAQDLLKRDPEFAAFVNAQMALPRYSATATHLPSPYKPYAELLPAPVALPAFVPVKRLSVRPAPKPVRVWEEIQLDSEHFMRLDQDGFTLDDYTKRDAMAVGSARLAQAIQQARAA